jgi:hypothetical protein
MNARHPPDKSMLRSLAFGLLALIALGTLSACVSGSFYWGPSTASCHGSASAARFGSGACRNGAENYVAWKKSRHALSQADLEPSEK